MKVRLLSFLQESTAPGTARLLLLLVVMLPQQQGPPNPAVTTGPPTAAHRDPIIRTFQRNAGLFASLGSFF